MPRRARMYLPGLPYHVVQRGNNREACFIEPENYQFYLVLWEELSRRYGLSVHAYCLMTNHKLRVQQQLNLAASLSVRGNTLKLTNLTAHKLISGYPEGRRMWLNVRWYNATNALVREDGAYGTIGRTVQDNAGVTHQVQSLLDLHDGVVYEAKPGFDQAWANQLLALGYASSLALEYDRMTDAPGMTLGQLGASPAWTQHHTFHFALNNVVTEDNRIPPYGFTYDEARVRNALPVPATQFGNPGPGGTYNYWDERSFAIPAGATRVEVRLYYQQTSWEYVQFLWKANDRLNTFLGNEGVNLLDAWLNTGQAAPVQISLANANVTGLRWWWWRRRWSIEARIGSRHDDGAIR